MEQTVKLPDLGDPTKDEKIPELTVFLVEDNPGDCFLVESYLDPKHFGVSFNLKSFHTLGSILSALRNGDACDLILVDMQLPDASGLQSIDKLTREFPEFPLVVLTAESDIQLALESLKIGALDFISKYENSSEVLQKTILLAIQRASLKKETILDKLKLNELVTFKRALLDAIPHPIYYKNQQGTLSGCNKAFELFYGVKETDFPENRELEDELNSRFSNDSAIASVFGLHHMPFKKEKVTKNHMGERRNVSLNISPILGREDETLGEIGIEVDLTELRLAQRELKNAKKRAELANRSKDFFLVSMSHEIRTPLNAIIGYAQLLGQTTDPEEIREYVSTIIDAGELQLEVINNILDFSKIEAGMLRIEHERFDFKPMIQDLKNLFSHEEETKDLSFVLAYDPEIPKTIIGDSLRLKQILLNLISNAFKFTARGSVTLKLELEEKTEVDCKIKLSVIDTGIGIAEDKRSEIFLNYGQSELATTRKFGGTGLGLPISQRLCQLMGSKIEVESDPGKGSTFAFTLKFEYDDSEEVKESASRHQGTGLNQTPRALRVLIVDDVHSNQKMMKHILRKMGHEYAIANNGVEAIDVMGRESYDVVLMDIQMPLMNGFETTEWIRSNFSFKEQPRIFALTASSTEEFRLRSVECGMDGFLNKPIKIAELRKILEQI